MRIFVERTSAWSPGDPPPRKDKKIRLHAGIRSFGLTKEWAEKFLRLMTEIAGELSFTEQTELHIHVPREEKGDEIHNLYKKEFLPWRRRELFRRWFPIFAPKP